MGGGALWRVHYAGIHATPIGALHRATPPKPYSYIVYILLLLLLRNVVTDVIYIYRKSGGLLL